ncbi:hypothetical protein CEXT_317211 [Caerostris extrusa]|uniref:Uncharacterized protein n=1 Tax=Caerostris extrusa TaxID=172846 RepID=A0AAV4P8I1_CAEEX|nr:hypothetical protein CEXT_317211 [Caerostris extrusa]
MQKFRRVVETRSEARTIPGRRVPFASVCICMIRTRFVFVCGYGSFEKELLKSHNFLYKLDIQNGTNVDIGIPAVEDTRDTRVLQKFRRVVETHSEARTIPGRRVPLQCLHLHDKDEINTYIQFVILEILEVTTSSLNTTFKTAPTPILIFLYCRTPAKLASCSLKIERSNRKENSS